MDFFENRFWSNIFELLLYDTLAPPTLFSWLNLIILTHNINPMISLTEFNVIFGWLTVKKVEHALEVLEKLITLTDW